MRAGRLCWLACLSVLSFAESVEGSVPQSPAKELIQQSTEVALSVEDARERKLLDRIEQLEKRVEALEYAGSAVGLPVAVISATTASGEYKMAAGLMARLEYRRDWSNQPFFDKNHDPESSKSMDTVTLGLLAFFGPKP